jgi:poly(A) polymerase
MALAALRRAVLAAAGRVPGPLVAPSAEAFRGLEPQIVRKELDLLLMGYSPRQGLQRLCGEGALEALLPEVAALVGFGEGDSRHKDVWEHTKQVVAQSPPILHVRWAALLHDIGKVRTRRTSEDGQIQFHGHAELGARMTRKILARLAFEPEQGRMIRDLVFFHQRPSQYETTWTDAAVRRFGREVGDLFEDLLKLSRADMTTKYDTKRRHGHALIDELDARVCQIRAMDARIPPLPKGLGLGIIERFSIAPGPRVGQLRSAVEGAVDRGELEPQQDEEVYLAWLEAHIGEI